MRVSALLNRKWRGIIHVDESEKKYAKNLRIQKLALLMGRDRK